MRQSDFGFTFAWLRASRKSSVRRPEWTTGESARGRTRATAIADEGGREPAGGWDFSCSSVPLVIRPATESAAATQEQLRGRLGSVETSRRRTPTAPRLRPAVWVDSAERNVLRRWRPLAEIRRL
jgi:hypothetical protein